MIRSRFNPVFHGSCKRFSSCNPGRNVSSTVNVHPVCSLKRNGLYQRQYRTAPWMSPSPFASKDRRKDGLQLLTPQECLVWVDCEMTGLESQDALLEIAMVITDNSLSVLMEGFNCVIHQPEGVLSQMVPEVKVMHTQTGLLDRVRDSAVSYEDADRQVNEYMDRLLADHHRHFMAGSSVYVDKAVLNKYLPRMAARFGHRIVDVTSIMEVVRRWMPHVVDNVDARRLVSNHKAMDDILASVSILRLLREVGFNDGFKS